MDGKAFGAHPYFGQQAALASMHGKEMAIAPPFAQFLNVTLCVPKDVDTDSFGTFSGDIPRTGTAAETVRKKARYGMALEGLPYGLASEGSFGPHRWFPIVAEHHELLIWIDDQLGFELVEQILSTDTNYDSMITSRFGGMDDFLSRVRFPSHALIVRPVAPKADSCPVWKGLRDRKQLEEAIRHASMLSQDGNALVQTDMRAHHNPARMKVIRQLAEKLAFRLQCRCQQCGSPGWGVVERLPGLPCSECGTPTDLIVAEIEGCVRCDYQEHRRPRDVHAHAPASRCPRCNP